MQISGSTRPVVRRHASSTSSVRPVPITMSITVSEPCRSRKASNPPPESPNVIGSTGYRQTSRASAASTQSPTPGSSCSCCFRGSPEGRDRAR
jgi:hypothetical protein